MADNEVDSAAGGSGDVKEMKVYPPIHRLGPAGRWLRGQLLTGIFRGTSTLLLIQNLRTPLLTSIVKIVSFMGEEEFYVLLIPFLTWIVDAKLGRQLGLLMAMGFYLTGFLKNCLCLPRPPSPPIIPVQRCNDWGLPSHHAVLSVNLPWYIWFYASLNYAYIFTPLMYTALFVTIATWSFCVMFSRMYLGVHSPADILTGGILGCLLLALWLQIDDILDSYIATGGVASLILPLPLIVVMLCLHPDPTPSTIIFIETLSMVAVATGFLIGRAHAPRDVLYSSIEKSHMYASALNVVACSVCRFVVGMIVILAAKSIAAMISRRALSYAGYLGGIQTVYEKRRSVVTSEKVHYSAAFTVTETEPSRPSTDKSWVWRPDRPLNIYIPVKFCSYVSLGFAAIELAPLTFYLLGI